MHSMTRYAVAAAWLVAASACTEETPAPTTVPEHSHEIPLAPGGGLQGKGTTAAPLSVSFAGSGAAATAARSDHAHDPLSISSQGGLGGTGPSAAPLPVQFAGAGSAASAARSDHTHDPLFVDPNGGLKGNGGGYAPLGVNFAGSGEATTSARSDHAHDTVLGLPQATAHEVTLSDTTIDLADQLAPLLAKHATVKVTLAKESTYTWNKLVMLKPFQALTIVGEGYTNGATNLTVTVAMTQNRDGATGDPGRAVARVLAYRQSYFELTGVNLVESANDTRPAVQNCADKALFSAVGDGAVIALLQSRVESSEHLTNFSGHVYGRVLIGHLFVNKGAGSPRQIYVTMADAGWCFRGNGGVVSRSHYTMGPDVLWDASGRITYLD